MRAPGLLIGDSHRQQVRATQATTAPPIVVSTRTCRRAGPRGIVAASDLSMSDEIARRVAALGGAARRQDILRSSGDARALDRSLDSGSLIRVARGVYGLPGCSAEVTAAAVHGAAVGCISAAALAGIALLNRPEQPHLSVPAGRGTSRSGLRDAAEATLHRESWVPAGRRRGVAVSPVGRALARMVLCCPVPDSVVALDSALRQRLTTTAAVSALLPRGADLSARVALALADGRSRSPLETVARLSLRAAGLRVEAGVVVPMVGEVDLVVEGRVVVELDGFAYHSGRREFDDDRRRDRELAPQGFIVLRFTARDVLYGDGRLVATVRAALAAPRRRPPLVRN